MSAVTRNYTIEQGATFTRIWSKKDSNGEVIDLTGYAARLQARVALKAPAAIIDLDTENSSSNELQIDYDTNEVILNLSAETTETFYMNSLVYDMEVYNIINPNVVFRWLQGEFAISKEVTR